MFSRFTSLHLAVWPLLTAGLSACGLLPTGGPSVTPNEAAILDRTTSGTATIVTYDTALMNRPEAEVYAQQVCEESDQTLEVVRHPPRAAGGTSTVTFTCRRPFS